MRQEVRVMLQLTLEVNATLDKKRIHEVILECFKTWTVDYKGVSAPRMVDIIEIREEAEIYGTED